MVDFIRAVYRGLARACLVALLFTLTGCTSGAAVDTASGETLSEVSKNIEKVNICAYGYLDLPNLRGYLRTVILDKKVSETGALEDIFQYGDYVQGGIRGFGSGYERYTGLPAGTLFVLHFDCLVSNGNANEWHLFVIADKTGKATVLQLSLMYRSNDFSTRREIPTPHLFMGSYWLADAVDKWGRKYFLTRDALKADLVSGGFLFNRSCVSGDTVSDIYVEPLNPPDSAHALLMNTHYFQPASAVAVFSADDGKFLQAVPGEGIGAGDCQVSMSMHWKQMEDWLETNYPENFLVKRIIKAGGIERMEAESAKEFEEYQKAKRVAK